MCLKCVYSVEINIDRAHLWLAITATINVWAFRANLLAVTSRCADVPLVVGMCIGMGTVFILFILRVRRVRFGRRHPIFCNCLRTDAISVGVYIQAMCSVQISQIQYAWGRVSVADHT